MDPFIGGEALSAGLTFAPTTDAVSSLSCINDSRIANAAVWTLHGSSHLIVQDAVVIRFVGIERISVSVTFVSSIGPAGRVGWYPASRKKRSRMLMVDRFESDDV